MQLTPRTLLRLLAAPTLLAAPLFALQQGIPHDDGEMGEALKSLLRVSDPSTGFFVAALGVALPRAATRHLASSNQIRLYFSSIAYCLLQALRELGLQGTKMARAQCSTIRVRLLKMGARVRVTARKVWISMATGHPAQALFAAVYGNLERGEPLRC